MEGRRQGRRGWGVELTEEGGEEQPGNDAERTAFESTRVYKI